MVTRPDPDMPLRLDDAAKHSGLPVSALRTEKRKGRLAVARIAGKDFTTLADIQRMFDLCREQAKECRLWFRSTRRDAAGKITKAARWIIKDGSRQISAGCGAGAGAEAERRLADYIASKYAPERRERALSEIAVADVVAIYLADVAPGQARPEKAGERAERLLEFFGHRRLDEITGALCRDYVEWRDGKGRSNKGAGGGAKRDLEDLRAAINHHDKEGLHREVVRVVSRERGKRRERWLTRDEDVRLLWVWWRTRETQEGVATDKRLLRHPSNSFAGLDTGSRPARHRRRRGIEARAARGWTPNAACSIGFPRAHARRRSASRPFRSRRACSRTCADGSAWTAGAGMSSPSQASRSLPSRRP